MPMISLKCPCEIPQNVLKELSAAAAEGIGKPEKYVMAVGSHTDVLLGGADCPAAFVDVRSIGGLTPEVNRRLSKKICTILESSLHIPPDHVYITFMPYESAAWGCNGTTFG